MKAHRRILSVLAVAALFMGPGPAQAATEKIATEGTNWFWASQKRQTPQGAVQENTGQDPGAQVCPNVPLCPDPQTGLPNPHENGSLPIQVLQGKDEKVSGVQFDFSFIPVQGASISSFKFDVVEATSNQEQGQTVNASGKKIQACLITASWASSLEAGADEMNDAPDVDTNQCAPGTRKVAAGKPRWFFDISTMAATWGDPAGARYGVMLMGVKPEGSSETWQIVLKGPFRDEAGKKKGQDNIRTQVTFTPGAATTYPTIPGATGYGSTGTTGFGFGTTTPTTTTPFPAATPAVPANSTFTSAGSPAADKGPGMPGYFWLIIPTALVALSLVRHTVLEPLPGKRSDGAVALIRHHNAARLGRSIPPDVTSPFAVVTRGLRGAGQRIRSVARRAVRAGRKR